MFSDQFYPTPKSLVDKMVAPWAKEFREHRYLSGKNLFLEPEAGKGDIVDYLIEAYNVKASDFSCIELNEELCMILHEKGYRVIDHDFLQYDGKQWFNFIIMNPPFKAGAEHLLKAWDILQEGKIVCVLNAETIRNPNIYDRSRLLELIAAHGRYEYVQDAFKDAQHTSNVEVAIVWLEKTCSESTINFEGTFARDGKLDDQEYTENFLTNRNIIKSLVEQFESAQRALLEVHRYKAQYRFYIKQVARDTSDSAVKDLNESLDNLKKLFWDYIFAKTEIGKKITSKFQEKFRQFFAQSSSLSFTFENIIQILETFVLNEKEILKECLINVFDKATSYHEDNKIYSEGWKTNKSYRATRKIIIPNCVEFTKWGSWRNHYYHNDFLYDIDKVMCFLSGKSLESTHTLIQAVRDRMNQLNDNAFGLSYTNWFESTNFRIKFFKKGTMHIFFKDEDLWNQFNIKAAEGKNWLGGGFE
jgi:hypothetical protein